MSRLNRSVSLPYSDEHKFRISCSACVPPASFRAEDSAATGQALILLLVAALVLDPAACLASAARIERLLTLIDVLDHAFLIDNKGRPICEPVLLVENAIFLGDVPLEITQQWKC